MTTRKKNERPLALLLSSKAEPMIGSLKLEPLLKLTVRIITLEEGKIRNCEHHSPAGGLVLEARCYSKNPTWGALSDGPEYDSLSGVGLRELEARTKYLRGVERRLEKLNEREGHPESFGAKVVRFARAVGAVGIYEAKSESGRGGWSYDDNEYRLHARPDDVQDRVNGLVREFFAAQEPKQEEATG